MWDDWKDPRVKFEMVWRGGEGHGWEVNYAQTMDDIERLGVVQVDYLIVQI